ncbi:MAG: penicillin-binding protein 1C [Deltaproteobacteria bacterium]|nr:MAG: penicillin-binding protein 1C [Deltaproteobacteria bacterium]
MKFIIKAFLILLFLFFILWVFIPDPGLYPHKTWSKAYKSKSGDLLRLTLSQDEKYRLFVPFEKISNHLKKATLFYEDKYFYSHPGVNFFSLIRGFTSTFILKKRIIGGSTITMQTARIRFKIDSSKIKGKFIQILRAFQLERHYSKNEIFEAYLNLVPYGGNIEGAGAASEIYFKKPASDLNIPEALALCLIPQNPCRRSPLGAKGKKELEKARKRLINAWNNEKKNKGINSLPLKFSGIRELPYKAPHFIDFIEKQDDIPLKGVINTTIDTQFQKLIESRLSRYIAKKRSKGVLNGAVLLLNYKTMEIEAMVGSADYFNKSIQGQVNGCCAKRSPGSTLKPFVYALAIDQGIIHSHTLLKDSPASFSGFTPENYDKKFEGPILAKDALIKSRNLPAIYLASKISNPDLYSFLKKAKVSNLAPKGFYGLSLVLGGGEVSMLELAGLYSIFGNYGELKSIKYLKNRKTHTIKKILSEDSCFIINSILAENPEPEKKSLFTEKSLPVSWKTGTSYGFRDAWAAGLFGDYVLCVWTGNFNGEGNPSFIGRKCAGPLFFDIINIIKKQKSSLKSHIDETKAFHVKKVDVCSKSGNLPGKFTPHTIKAWFIPGVSPIKVSTLHREVLIDKKTGKRACKKEKTTRKEIYEFWSTDMKKLFEKGGIYLKTPPPYKRECLENNFTDKGISPLIFSPHSGIKYITMKNDFKKIPFKASAEPGIEKIYWFVNSNYEGFSSPDKVFMWKARPGKYIITASDDFGRTDKVCIEIVYKEK